MTLCLVGEFLVLPTNAGMVPSKGRCAVCLATRNELNLPSRGITRCLRILSVQLTAGAIRTESIWEISEEAHVLRTMLTVVLILVFAGSYASAAQDQRVDLSSMEG